MFQFIPSDQGKGIKIKPENAEIFSPVRIASRTENLFPVLENHFAYELKFSFNEHEIIPPQLLKSTFNGMWQVQLIRKINYAYKDTIEIAISFDVLFLIDCKSSSFL